MKPRARYSPLGWALALPVRAWRAVSRWLPSRCRFHPSCSSYALEALQVHGGVRGGSLAVRRVARCHPWNPGGFDPVPDAAEHRRGPNKCLQSSGRPGPASTV